MTTFHPFLKKKEVFFKTKYKCGSLLLIVHETDTLEGRDLIGNLFEMSFNVFEQPICFLLPKFHY